MATETTRSVVTEFFEAYSAGDAARFVPLLDPEIVYEMEGPADLLPFYGTSRGLSATLSSLGRIGALYEMLAYTVEDLLADGDRAAVRARGRFRHRASGRIVTLAIAVFLKIANGRVVEIREINDTLTAHRDTFALDLKVLARGA
jgi:ketosteroid isomerase-like protein